MNDNNSVMSIPVEGKNYLEVDLYAKGDKGDIFVPFISQEGVLSWTIVGSDEIITPPESITLRNGMALLFVNSLPSIANGKDDVLYALKLSSGTANDKKYQLYYFVTAANDPSGNAHYERVDSGYWGSPAATITNTNINYWNGKANVSDIPDVSNFITKDVNNLTNYELKTNTGSVIDLSVNTSTFVVTLKLKNSAGTVISTDTIDLPIESVVVSGQYDSTNKKIILTLQNGNTIDIPVGGLISGLQSEITSSNKLSSDLVDDTNKTHKFITAAERTAWNAKSDFSGSYDDLTNKPTIPVVNDAKLTIQKNGTKVVDFTANSNTDTVANIIVPTKVSDLTNDSGFLTSEVNSNLVNANASGSLRTVYAMADGSSYSVGTYAFAEGTGTKASGSASHAEGNTTTASGTQAHAEGYYTTASGSNGSHAEGYYTTASGQTSHAEGRYTTATGQNQHVEGKFNILDSNNTYAHIIGNGTGTSARSNAHTVDWNGNAWYKGDVYVGGTSQTSGSSKLAKISDIPTNVSAFTNDSGYTTNTGTVTKVTAGTGLTGGDITTTGTIALDASGVTAGTYQGITVDTYGRVTAATNQGYTTNTGTITEVAVNGTSVATSGQANITSVPASILTGAITNGVTATTQQSGDNSTKVATTAYVDSAIAALPGFMVFKGSLGTGGTITSLPAAAAANSGFTYKVITDGTYASQNAKVGDMFISNGTGWILIPSGDEPSGTVTSITLNATGPIVIDDNSAITTSGTRTLSHATSGVVAGTYTSVTVDNKGHVTNGSNPELANSHWVNGSQTGSVRTTSSQQEGSTYTIGQYAVAEGLESKATGVQSHAEGYHSFASGTQSHAEGYSTEASGNAAHAEGFNTIASGEFGSHAEGRDTVAQSNYSHAEGQETTASNNAAHAEGYSTTASGLYAHAEGRNTMASGASSHTEGYYTIAQASYQHVEGKYNVTSGSLSNIAHIVGNGTADDARSNAHTLDFDGVAWFAGDVYVDSTSGTNKDAGSVKLARMTDLPTDTSDLTNNAGYITNAVNDLTYYTLSSDLASVATTGDYNDLINLPTIPTKTSNLINDSGFITSETDPVFTASPAYDITDAKITYWDEKQAELISGTNIKTINGTSLLGYGNITIETGQSTMTVPNSDYNVTGGIRTRLDPLTHTLYITNDSTDA